MEWTALNELRSVAFHRAVVRRAHSNPDLMGRMVDHIGTLRTARPDLDDAWRRWLALLAAPEDRALAAVLDPGEDGRRLRAVSPLAGALYPAERTMVWRCVGWIVFLHHYQDAAADLGLGFDDQAAITGFAADSLADWDRCPPERMDEARLEGFRQVVSIQRALALLFVTPAQRQHWLAEPVRSLGAAPIDLLRAGRAEVVCAHLTLSLGPRLAAADLPRY